jgi:hypothetical protein
MTGSRLVTSGARIALALSLTTAAACASRDRGGQVAGAPKDAAHDYAEGSQACERICEASAACGDQTEACEGRCKEWLVRRSRSGIARAAARCAVPRIELACGEDHAKGAARALVACVDEAGRVALRDDKKTLFVAARAICERGARCNGGSASDATRCVDKMMRAEPTPRGLGIFGAMRPELVDGFASCMQSTSCGPSGAACFGEILGESVPDDDEHDGGERPPAPGPTTDPGGTSI